MSEATVINESCQCTAWSGGASFYTTMDTFAKLQAQLDAWAQFTLADLADLKSGASSISILPATVFQNGVLTLHYSLNGKDGLTYGWARHYGMTGDGPAPTVNFGATGKSALIIPGSGLNQADQIITYNSGYQNTMYNPVCTIGDGFVHILPGSDFRLLAGTNGKGYLRESIARYLLNAGSGLALLEIIEACAILTWLKANYTKTAVLGISDSAYHAAIVGIIGAPDAVVAASGFSLSTKAQGFGLAGDNAIPGIYNIFDEADFASGINGAATKYRFSQSSTAEIAVMLEESGTGYTAGVLTGANVTHVTHSAGHVYDIGMGAWLVANL